MSSYVRMIRALVWPVTTSRLVKECKDYSCFSKLNKNKHLNKVDIFTSIKWYKETFHSNHSNSCPYCTKCKIVSENISVKVCGAVVQFNQQLKLLVTINQILNNSWNENLYLFYILFLILILSFCLFCLLLHSFRENNITRRRLFSLGLYLKQTQCI